MKSILRKILFGIIAVMTAFACVSCSNIPGLDFLSSLGKKPTGIYGDIDEDGFGYTYDFDGNEVTYSLWKNGVPEVLVKAPYEIKGGKIKIISDEYFDGSVKEDGKYVVSKAISFETDENGNESIKIGINSFSKMEEADLPQEPEEPAKELSGIYGDIDENGTGFTYEFKDGEVTYTVWNKGKAEEVVKAPYEIKDGQLKITSDQKFTGGVENGGKYVLTKPIAFEKDESGKEIFKLGNDRFVELEEKDLPKNPDTAENPENNNTPTAVTITDLKNALIEASTTENKNFEATYTLSEVYTEGGRTETINYSMQMRAKGTDRYLNFSIGSLTTEAGASQGNRQIVEIWYKGGDSYIKAITWQEENGKTMDRKTNSIKASGQSFDAVCQNLKYPISALLGMGSELNSLLSDTSATATAQNGIITYELDCTNNSEARASLFRVSKAFAIEILSDSFTDADVSYSVGSASGLMVTYVGKYTPVDSVDSTVTGSINFKTYNSEITVPSDVSSAEDKGSGYKSWYSSLEGIAHR